MQAKRTHGSIHSKRRRQDMLKTLYEKSKIRFAAAGIIAYVVL